MKQPHPDQPLVSDELGVLRFKENKLVSAFVDQSMNRGLGLNWAATQDFSAEDRMQLAQLIGYSLHGYGTLSYVTDESFAKVQASIPPSVLDDIALILADPGTQKQIAMREKARQRLFALVIRTPKPTEPA